jgi:hypothetical protein
VAGVALDLIDREAVGRLYEGRQAGHRVSSHESPVRSSAGFRLHNCA